MLTIKEAQEMVSEIAKVVSYDSWKDNYDGEGATDETDTLYNINQLVEIVKEYVTVHYC